MSSWIFLRRLQRVSRDTFLSNQKEVYPLSSNKITDLFEQAVEVHMNTVSTRGVKQDILTMTITQTKDMTHHTHNRWRAAVCQTAHVPEEKQKLQDGADTDFWRAGR